MSRLAPKGGKTTAELKRLSDESEKDKPWDTHRATAQTVAQAYRNAPADEQRLQNYAKRVNACAPWLRFNLNPNKETGEVVFKLDNAFFCRVRTCPVCQWRRSLMWKARMFESLENIKEKHPAGRWLFLTLTVKNCEVTEVKNTLSEMGKAWKRLTERKEFSNVLGWVRTVEVTRNGSDDSAHPHFHVLLFVKSTYFKHGNYISADKWAGAWSACLRGGVYAHPTKSANIKAVKKDADGNIGGAVAEVMKYSVKPADMTDDQEWFLEITRQLFRTRAIASGGVLKDLFKAEKSADELLKPDGGDDENEAGEAEEQLLFNWYREHKFYARRRS